MNIKENLGKRLKEIRKNKDLTQEALAKLIDIDYKNLGKIEAGLNYPTSTTLEKIVKALQIEPKDLFDFSHHQEPEDIESEIVEIFRAQDEQKRRILYNIIKTFK